MCDRTVLNERYEGLVEALSIPAQLHERAGRKYASFGSAVPIHCCSDEQVLEMAPKTHHYCGIFTEQVLAPLGELAYVRLDADCAEKVFVNRNKRMLVWSSDGALAQWRRAPAFESANRFLPGAPVVDARGALVALVLARKGNHYALSNFEGEGGYFETSLPWQVMSSPGLLYGARAFSSRDELRAHVAALPPAPPAAAALFPAPPAAAALPPAPPAAAALPPAPPAAAALPPAPPAAAALPPAPPAAAALPPAPPAAAALPPAPPAAAALPPAPPAAAALPPAPPAAAALPPAPPAAAALPPAPPAAAALPPAPPAAAALPPAPPALPPTPPTPVLHQAAVPRVALVAAGGRQIAHIYLQDAITDPEYL